MTTPMIEHPRTLHVEHSMGTVFTIDIRDGGAWAAAIADVCTWLHRVDRVFSTYRDDSEICRIQRGELAVADADPDVAVVLDECARLQRQTAGYFTAVYAAKLDPTGFVKGWAIERASAMLRAHGSRNHAVNGGGDVQAAGEAAPGQPWRIGITDPHGRARVRDVVSGRDFAVATSGVAERGAHIINPFSGVAATELASVTVVGPSLTIADVYATAAFAMGDNAVRWLQRQPAYDGLVVDADGHAHTTSGWTSAAA